MINYQEDLLMFILLAVLLFINNSAGIYLFRVNNGNTRTMCEIFLQLTTNIPEPHQRRCSGVFINYEYITLTIFVFPLLNLKK